MGQVFSMVRDGLVSLASRMGTDRDKAASVFYTQPILTDEQIIAAYRGSWLPRKIVDIPALDSCRKWRNWQAASDQIGLIDAEERRLNLRGKVLEASTKARLFGGAALFIGAEDTDPAVTIHPSQLVIFKGAMTPNEEFGGPGNHAWGESVLAATFDAIKNADSTAANIASLVFEAKIDIIKVPQFSANIGNQAYEDAVLRRYALANTIKGVNGTLILDAEEEYDSKSAPLSGLTDILMAFLQIVAGAADIPVTRLLGQSPAGMNATGTADMKNYHDRIQAIQELDYTPAMSRLDECLIRSATGARDPAIYATWAPLEQMSEAERADIFKTKAEAARALFGSASGEEIIPRQALSEALLNAFVEDGSLPGLEAAVKTSGRPDEVEQSETGTDAA